MRRRDFLPALATATVAAAQTTTTSEVPRKGRLKQACFRRNFDPKMPFDEMCRQAARIGIQGFSGASQQEWPTLKKYALIPTMSVGGGISIDNGIIRNELHEEQVKSLGAFIDACAGAGGSDILITGGRRHGRSYTEGADIAVSFLNRVKSRAEDKGVNLCLEVMNSKYKDPAIGREDQIGDHLSWVADVCRRVGSPRVKVLFDIYHVQIMDGNIVANIREYFPLIGQFHAAGVPGRREIDDTQELNYRFIARVIADLGFTGFVCHEYDPAPGHDPIESLEKTFALVNV
jgi:hydroxypyruvate isomerase